jgi:hypothetical protein
VGFAVAGLALAAGILWAGRGAGPAGHGGRGAPRTP